MSPFDWIKVLNEKSKAEFDSSYSPFIINKGLSFNDNNIFFANEMNSNYELASDIQFDFYFNIIPKNKKFSKWIKKEQTDENIQLIMEFFDINRLRATEYLNILPSSEIEKIKNKMIKGGRNAKK